jgi:hypothetical protein
MRTNQERMDVKMEAMHEKNRCQPKEMKADQEHLKEEIMAERKVQIDALTSRMDAKLEGTKDCREVMEARIGMGQKHMEADIKTGQKKMMSVVDHQEVPKEAAVETIRALGNQYGNQGTTDR